VGSDRPYLSNKIMTLYVENEVTSIISAHISVNKIWLLCPVLVYYELATVP
jgi:frataxin-like iron-binding protein CyaY